MKYNIPTIALLFCFLTACSPAPEADVQHKVIIQPSVPELTLQQGGHWQTDDYTDVGVRVLQESAWQFKGQSLEEYNSLGREMEGVLLQLFKNTTIRGEARDMLRVFLMPVAQDVKKLERKDLAEAMEAHRRISERLKLYEHYFKVNHAAGISKK